MLSVSFWCKVFVGCGIRGCRGRRKWGLGDLVCTTMAVFGVPEGKHSGNLEGLRRHAGSWVLMSTVDLRIVSPQEVGSQSPV